MAKPYSVTPILRPNTKYYVATFKTASGNRVSRGLGTDDLSRARLICAGLVALRNKGIQSAADTPIDVPLESARLYFNMGKASDGDVQARASDVADRLPLLRAQAKTFPVSIRAKILTLLYDRDRLQRESEQQRLEIAALKRDLRVAREDAHALGRTMLGRAVKSGKNIPALRSEDTHGKTVFPALDKFRLTMDAATSKGNVRDVLSVARRFVGSLPADRHTLADVTTEDVMQYLDSETVKGAEHKRASRRDALRRRLGRFLNWSARQWEYPSQMLLIQPVKKAMVDRERGEIHYHQQNEVEEAIERLPGIYWKTLVAVLGYAGAQLAELCWLRNSDLEISSDGKSGSLTITTVQDPDDPTAVHLLKTEHRKRKVNLHAGLLLPRIKEYLKRGFAGKTYLFPMPVEMRRVADREQWLVASLGVILRGHKGGKRRTPVAALLPKGMNAKSLRRTSASLLLRSGKTHAEVAAAMGNSAEIVEQHYGRMRGEEVLVNF